MELHAKALASPLSQEKLGRVVDLHTEGPTYEIQSGQMVGVLSLERVVLPLSLCGRLGIRSSFARVGITAFGGVQFDPGFSGRLTMNLLNVGPQPVPLHLGEVMFTVEFQRLDEAADRPYSGPYQDQDDFPADQYNYILSAHTTSLAEIPTLRMGVARLRNVIEELEESLPDPDESLELRPDVLTRLKRSASLSSDSLVSLRGMRRRLNLED